MGPENAVFTINFTQSQLIALGGAGVGIFVFMSTMKKILSVAFPKIYNNKIFQAFLPDFNILLGIIFMLGYRMWDNTYINISAGILLGNFCGEVYKSIKTKIANGNGSTINNNQANNNNNSDKEG